MDVTFEKGNKTTDTWLTPPQLLKSLGEFDLDPCCPVEMPWPTAKKHYTETDNGLMQNWEGRVWCNPPYSDAGTWLGKCCMHGNAIALVFARTETNMFFEYVWKAAHGILFIRGRISFYNAKGEKGSSAGAPSVLIAYGKENAEVLSNLKIGKFIRLRD